MNQILKDPKKKGTKGLKKAGNLSKEEGNSSIEEGNQRTQRRSEPRDPKRK